MYSQDSSQWKPDHPHVNYLYSWSLLIREQCSQWRTIESIIFCDDCRAESSRRGICVIWGIPRVFHKKWKSLNENNAKLWSVNSLKLMYTFCLFLSVNPILENLKVSKKLNSVSGCTLEVLLINVVSCHNKSCTENDVVLHAILLLR